MPNVQDHAISIGGQSLEQRPFDEIDALILTQIVYMPMEGFLDKGGNATIGELWAFLQETYPDSFTDPFQRKRYHLTQACSQQPRYVDWRIHSYINHIDAQREMQFAVCSFALPQGLTVVSFRGTDLSLAGWKEDLNMSFMTVPAQQEAVEYVERIAAHTGDAISIGGHSKGGNLAVYAATYVDGPTRERVRRVYSFDGPGLAREALESQGYQLVRERIESYIPQSSVVGMLLYHHPVYTVVRSTSLGILQHDAMTWQVEEGAFVCLRELNTAGKLTDEAIHAWLADMDNDQRKLLVDTLYQVISAAQEETVSGLVVDWYNSARKILGALRELDPELRKNVRHMLGSLFSVGATEALRSVLPQSSLLSSLINRKSPEPEDAKYNLTTEEDVP